MLYDHYTISATHMKYQLYVQLSTYFMEISFM